MAHNTTNHLFEDFAKNRYKKATLTWARKFRNFQRKKEEERFQLSRGSSSSSAEISEEKCREKRSSRGSIKVGEKQVKLQYFATSSSSSSPCRSPPSSSTSSAAAHRRRRRSRSRSLRPSPQALPSRSRSLRRTPPQAGELAFCRFLAKAANLLLLFYYLFLRLLEWGEVFGGGFRLQCLVGFQLRSS